MTRTADRDRPLGAHDGRGRRQHLGDVAGGLAEPGAAGREVEAHDARRRAVDQHVLAVELPVRDARRVQGAQLGPGAVEQGVAQGVGAEVVELGTRDLLDDEQRERVVRAGDDHPRRVDTRVARQQREVRLVLHLRASARDQRRRRVAVREIAPRAGEQLRIGFVAPEGDDPHRPVRGRGHEHRATDGLLARGAYVARVDAECLQCGGHLRDRWPTDGRAEEVLDRVGDAPAEHDGGDQIGGEPARQVQARDGEQRHETLAETPRRPGEMR